MITVVKNLQQHLKNSIAQDEAITKPFSKYIGFFDGLMGNKFEVLGNREEYETGFCQAVPIRKQTKDMSEEEATNFTFNFFYKERTGEHEAN